MKWRKKKLKVDDEDLAIWINDEGTYQICQNINHGKVGPNDSKGGWWFEILRLDGREYVDVGEAPSLKVAQYVAEDDAEEL